MPVQPRKAMCSCACAMPGNPGGVSLPPTRKFISTVTTGASVLRKMMTRIPFASVSSRRSAAALAVAGCAPFAAGGAAGDGGVGAALCAAASPAAPSSSSARTKTGAGVSRRSVPAQRTEAPLPAGEIPQRLMEADLVEVRPQAAGKMQLRVGALPEQKIAQPLLATGADEQIHLAGVVRAVIDLVQQASKSLDVEMRIAGGAACGLQDAVLG